MSTATAAPAKKRKPPTAVEKARRLAAYRSHAADGPRYGLDDSLSRLYPGHDNRLAHYAHCRDAGLPLFPEKPKPAACPEPGRGEANA